MALSGVDPQDIDDCVFSFDPRALPASLRGAFSLAMLRRLSTDDTKAERLPASICRHLGVRQAWFISHHYSHALSTWMLEQRPADVQVVIEGVGDGRPWSVYKGDRMVAVGDIRNGSIGWGMRDAGKLLGITAGHDNDIADKLMGLQSFGAVDAGYLQVLDRFGFDRLKDLWSVEHWYDFKGNVRDGQHTHMDWVATVHQRMGDMLVAFFRQFAQAGDTISYSGGVAQNVLWNAQLRAHFPQLVIPPHASDEGLSLGGLEWLRRQHEQPAFSWPDFPYAQGDTGVPAPSERTLAAAVELLAQGKLLGWYQGHGEIGPRALGNRSILLDPRLADGRERMNRVKERETYQPFGASVLEEHFAQHFSGAADEFMLYACEVKMAAFAAITHVDGTSRVQVVGNGNPVFRRLLQRFHAGTGCPMLMNSSLNIAGKPMAGTPEDAMQLFRDSEIDAMVIGDELLVR